MTDHSQNTIHATEQTRLRQSRPGASKQFKSFLRSHLDCFLLTLSQLISMPLATLMTSAALGISLALPAGLYEMINHIQEIGGQFNKVNEITLYMKQEASDQQAAEMLQQLQQLKGVIRVEHKTREQALEEFQQYSGFGDALQALNTNPLPHVFIIEPSPQYSDPVQIEKLLLSLKQLPLTGAAQLDVQWIKRLFAIISVGRTGVLVIAVLLSLAVLLIVGNTIRLAIENRRQEILVIKLIGGTNSFIRRPFLYTGIWYGLLGGILAVILIDLSLMVINYPLSELGRLYQQSLLQLDFMSLSHKLQLLLISMLLGLGGALIAVNRQLRLIELK